jgi:hypothetical protein
MNNAPSSTPIGTKNLRQNLTRAGSRAFAAYQQAMDVNVFLLSGSLLANEKEFATLKSGHRFAPSARHALSFERAKFESQRWVLKNFIQDGLRVFAILVEDIRSICSMLEHEGKADAELEQAIRKVTGESRLAALKVPLLSRIEDLQTRFGINLPHRDAIAGFVKLANCLQSNRGVVGKADTTDGSGLVVHFMSIMPQGDLKPDSQSLEGAAAASLRLQVRPATRSIPVGQAVEFSHDELIGTLLTFCIAASLLLNEADKFLASSETSDEAARVNLAERENP